MLKLCPMFREPCKEHGCAWYTHLIGMDPQTGVNIDVWDCNQNLMPKLTIENSQQQRQTGAAVESFRNEVMGAKGRDQLIELGKVLPALDGGR